MFKTKFVAEPQLDAEGFVMLDAPCLGCGPADMCPRSGHCQRYQSPLRDVFGIAAWMAGMQDKPEEAVMILADVKCMQCEPPCRLGCLPGQPKRHSGVCEPEQNPPGWQEVGGVQLPPITWAEPMVDGIEKLSDSSAPDAYFGWRRD